MSALGDVAAALLPPEAGGPPPERAAAAARHLIDRMPAPSRAGVAAALLGLETAALVRSRRTLGRLPADERARLLADIAGRGTGQAAAVDLLKTLLMLAWGATSFGEEIVATASRHEPARPDPRLALVPAAELGEETRCDAVVVGSGAGGAFAARALARAGLDVVVVEEGERWTVSRIRETPALERFASLYRDGGATVALGMPPIALPLGRAIGGTTVINSGTCFRPPEAVARAWHEGAGLALAEPAMLDERLADVEETLGVGPVPADVMGRNGELALSGAAALGWSAQPLRRNAPGCRGACQCAIGCPNNAKAGVHLNALPQACEAGARIVPGLRVRRLLIERGQATGVEGELADGRRLRIRAPIAIVSAGAIETPPLLRRSGIGRHPRVGRGLSIHPSLGVVGSFAEAVVPWHGVLQSVGVEELHEREGILLEATSTPPGMGSMAFPGYGAPLLARIDRADHSAAIGGMIADAPSGRVIGTGRPLIAYRLAAADRRRLLRALEAMAKVMLAAGAETVELGGGAPAVHSAAGIEAALERVEVARLHLAAFHPTGSAAAGSDAALHPVDEQGRLRGVEGVWVADGSILPSCPGVNPQVSIMALAAGVGEAVTSAAAG